MNGSTRTNPLCIYLAIPNFDEKLDGHTFLM